MNGYLDQRSNNEMAYSGNVDGYYNGYASAAGPTRQIDKSKSI